MQWPYKVYGPTVTSAAQRARAASAHTAPHPERERPEARSHVHSCEHRLLVGGRGRHVGSRPCTEGERRLDGAVGFHVARADSN